MEANTNQVRDYIGKFADNIRWYSNCVLKQNQHDEIFVQQVTSWVLLSLCFSQLRKTWR